MIRKSVHGLRGAAGAFRVAPGDHATCRKARSRKLEGTRSRFTRLTGYLAVLRIAYREPLAPPQLATWLNKQGLCTARSTPRRDHHSGGQVEIRLGEPANRVIFFRRLLQMKACHRSPLRCHRG